MQYQKLQFQTGPDIAFYSREIDGLYWYQQIRWYLVDLAREASEHARSYRGFKVGAVIYAQRPEGGLPEKFLGFNTKETPEDDKICAEQRALWAAIAAGYTNIIAVVVVGVAQPDGRSGLLSLTLHPCERCRDILTEYLSDDTVVFTAGFSDEDSYEEQTWAELLARHDH